MNVHSQVFFARASKCLGGLRISTLHARRNCGFLNRADSIGTLFEVRPDEYPPEVMLLMTMCEHCAEDALPL
jgi:hypothetical protein